MTLQTLPRLQLVINVRDGQTIALGGFDSRFVAAFSPQSEAKPVPMLGDIPLISTPKPVPALGQIPTIGRLFRSKTADDRQLMVLVTVRIVRLEGEAAP